MLMTERLLLRRTRGEDANAVHAISDIVGHGRKHRTLDETRAMCATMEERAERDPGWQAYVIERIGGSIIGGIGVCFDRPEAEQAELGCSLHPDQWGDGYAEEALRAIIPHLFFELELHRLTAITSLDNPKAQSLLQRLGFRQEAHYKEAFYDYRAARWIDVMGFGLLAKEWRHS